MLCDVSLPLGFRLLGFPAGQENIGWLLLSPDRRAVSADAPDAADILAVLADRHLRLEAILLTHRHADHTAGLAELVSATGCPILEEPAGQTMTCLEQPLRVLDTSGHSPCDRTWYFPTLAVAFVGDTLFDMGCGRMFAGPPERFWSSLLALRALPDDTRLCCGHDYAEVNRRFVSRWFPDWTLPPARLPLLLGEQIRFNPFLMADHPSIAQALRLDHATPPEVFAALRAHRNHFE